MTQLIEYDEEIDSNFKHVTTLWMFERSNSGDGHRFISLILHKAIHATWRTANFYYPMSITFFEIQIDCGQDAREYSDFDIYSYWEIDELDKNKEIKSGLEEDVKADNTTQLKSDIETNLDSVLGSNSESKIESKFEPCLKTDTFVEVDIVTLLKAFLDTDTETSLISYLEGYLRAICDNNLAVDKYLEDFRTHCLDTLSDTESAKYFLNLFNSQLSQQFANVDEDYAFVLKCDQELENVEDYVKSLSVPEIQSILETISSEKMQSDSVSTLAIEFDSDAESVRSNLELKPKCLRSELLQYVMKHSDKYFTGYLEKIVEIFTEEYAESYLREYLEKRMMKYLKSNLCMNLDSYLNTTFEMDWTNYLSTSLLTDFDAYVNTHMKRDIELYINTHLNADLNEHLEAYVETYLKLRLMSDPAADADEEIDSHLSDAKTNVVSDGEPARCEKYDSYFSQDDNMKVGSLVLQDLPATKPQFACLSSFPLVGLRIETDFENKLTTLDWIRFQRYYSAADLTYDPIAFMQIPNLHYEVLDMAKETNTDNNYMLFLSGFIIFVITLMIFECFLR